MLRVPLPSQKLRACHCTNLSFHSYPGASLRYTMKKIKNCIHCFYLLFSQLCRVRVALTGSALRCSYIFFASKKEAKVPCKHFGEESICSIMFFFSNQSSFVPFSTIQLCSPALCPSPTKAWNVFRAKFCTPASFGGNESPVRRTCRFEPEDIT